MFFAQLSLLFIYLISLTRFPPIHSLSSIFHKKKGNHIFQGRKYEEEASCFSQGKLKKTCLQLRHSIAWAIFTIMSFLVNILNTIMYINYYRSKFILWNLQIKFPPYTHICFVYFEIPNQCSEWTIFGDLWEKTCLYIQFRP